MRNTKTPCIGICSTTSLGDVVCRGCKRFAFEVINWNGYGEAEKSAVLARIEALNRQIIEDKLFIYSSNELAAGLQRLGVTFDPAQSPDCWLHNLMKKHQHQIQNFKDFGVTVKAPYRNYSIVELIELIDREILALSTAHFERYLRPGLVK